MQREIRQTRLTDNCLRQSTQPHSHTHTHRQTNTTAALYFGRARIVTAWLGRFRLEFYGVTCSFFAHHGRWAHYSLYCVRSWGGGETGVYVGVCGGCILFESACPACAAQCCTCKLLLPRPVNFYLALITPQARSCTLHTDIQIHAFGTHTHIYKRTYTPKQTHTHTSAFGQSLHSCTLSTVVKL